MGLDVYAGPVTRYVAGDWLTIVQQAGRASGMDVRLVRHGVEDGDDVVQDPDLVFEVVDSWKRGLLEALGARRGWDESVDGEYLTDKPDWDGYGAVVLLAAFDERPDLGRGGPAGRRNRRGGEAAVLPRDFPEAAAFQAAQESPQRYPTLLLGAEWCLPVIDGPTVFQAPTPNGTPLSMGRVDRLLGELHTLNDRTLRLSEADLAAARDEGPPPPKATVDEVAPFGLAVLTALAEFAMRTSAAWIMDY